MDIDLRKFRRSLQDLIRLPDDELHECLRLWVSTCARAPCKCVLFMFLQYNLHLYLSQTTSSTASVDKAVDLLSHRLLNAQYTDAIRDKFPDLLILIVTRAFPMPMPAAVPDVNHVAKCVALSKLVAKSQHIRK